MSGIVIVDTGGANLASLRFALQRLDCEATVSRDPGQIVAATHVLLPGVGAAADTMARLRDHQLNRLLTTLTQPVLGICLGMQILACASDEGDTPCLGLIPGRASRLESAPGQPVPHMGWNRVNHDGTGLFAGLNNETYVYFVHSYVLPVDDSTVATCRYGSRFAAAVSHNNFYGTQFHPERSGAAGARILKNFLGLASGAFLDARSPRSNHTAVARSGT